ncbi:MAG: DUF6434 domain-containing protein [Pseudomonadota bacterium]
MSEPASDAERRPPIADVATGDALRDWYWLKAELVAHARTLGVSTAGSKAAITERLAARLDGIAPAGSAAKAGATRPKSTFDWHSETLTHETVITDSYRNTQNVRRFFKAACGPGFRFNIAFMAWMRAHVGRTLGDAVEARRAIAEREAREKPTIPPGNQYNAYTRAFFAANPERSLDDARRCWAAKRARRGHNRYEDADLAALHGPG